MKKHLLILSFLLGALMTQAAPRSLSEMMEVAKGVIKAPSATTRGSSARMEVLQQGRQFTVVGYAKGGFAVIANDDRFNAVLGYSDTEFSTGDMPPGLRWWMNAADEALRHSLSTDAEATSGAEVRSAEYPEAVAQLMTTEWNQGAPYNNLVVERWGYDFPTGCVATAMAQIMRYHEYPAKGKGSKLYRFTPATEGIGELRAFANFGQATYNYAEMIDRYAGNNYTPEQANAVATLMYHCGVAVEMNYDLGGSGAYDNVAAKALEQYFGYSTKFYVRDVYTTRDWMNIIYEEISSGRPILYGGATPQFAGHAFVFDGYNADGLVHVNWGWSGSGDGYFDVAILDSGTGSYSEQQDMVIIHDADQPEIPYTSQWGLLDWPLQNVKGSFSVSLNGMSLTYSASHLYNVDAADFTGSMALVASPVGDGESVILYEHDVVLTDMNTMQQYDNIGHLDGYAYGYGNTADISALPDGTYRVYLASKATSETEWQPVRSNETVVNNYLLTISGGAATVAEGDPGWTTGIENAGASAPNGDGMVRVYTADGVLVYSAKADAFSLDDVPARGILIVKRGAETVKVVK